MMVLFQNKIIYMPFLPPNARSDTIDDYGSHCGGVKWKEEHIRSGDGTDIALAVSEVGSEKEEGASATEKVVLYFQGNDYFQIFLSSFLYPRLHMVVVGHAAPLKRDCALDSYPEGLDCCQGRLSCLHTTYELPNLRQDNGCGFRATCSIRADPRAL